MLAVADSMENRCFADSHTRVPFRTLIGRTGLPLEDVGIADASVLTVASSQLNAAMMMVELDGLARRIVLCPPGLSRSDYQAAIADADVDLVITDDQQCGEWSNSIPVIHYDAGTLRRSARRHAGDVDTEWVLFTSGTSGRPKLAVHSLASLVGVRPVVGEGAAKTVWSTFYDIRRYGGLQILLRASLSQSSMIFSPGGAFDPGFLDRARAEEVSHISGTPSHWRLVLAAGGIKIPSLRYIRLSGETCDQPLLDQLAHAYPFARIDHAFASTEAGLVFDVTDRLAGIPLEALVKDDPSKEIDITSGSLRVRSRRCASRYLGCHASPLQDPDGFVDTGDLVEERQGRIYFLGRRGGIINVGGSKIHPESVESVINNHPAVRISRVHGAKSPIMGSIIVGDVVLAPSMLGAPRSPEEIKVEILDLCRRSLPRHHVPVRLNIVPTIALGPAGKMLRNHA